MFNKLAAKRAGRNDATHTSKAEPPVPDEKGLQSSSAPETTSALPKLPIQYYYLSHDTEPPVQPLPGAQDILHKTPPSPNLRPFNSPLRWGTARKSFLLALTCIATFLTAYSAGAYSPPAQLIADDLHTTKLVTLVGITTFCLGFALIPMAAAPISEIAGRYPVFVISGITFVIFQVVCAVMPNIAGMLVARFLVGAGSSVFSAVVGGVIADMYGKEERNTPMALFSGCVLGGTGAGPLVSTAIINSINDGTRAWKWTFWHQVIMDVALVLAIIVFFNESRGSVLLSRKAACLNSWYEELEGAGICGMIVDSTTSSLVPADDSDWSSTTPSPRIPSSTDPTGTAHVRRIRWVVKEDEQRPTLLTMILISVKRPFHMLFTEPVVFCFSLWAAFAWGILYLSFSVVPFLYQGDFGLSSRVYAAIIVAAAVATFVGILQERLLEHPQWRNRGPGDPPYSDSRFWEFMRRRFPADAPEARLYFACITSILLPAGLLGGFLSPSYMDGYSHAVGLGFATWGIYSVYLATFNYLADTYHVYASSALAAQSACRNILGGIFPVITSALFTNLRLRGAGGLLGGIAMVLTLIPWVLVMYGSKIRAKSKFAQSLQK